MSRIIELCKEYTTLKSSDINILLNLEQFLPLISEIIGCDVFIDCITSDTNKAIVASEFRPKNSLYKNSVVGMLAYRDDEPAAIRTLELGIPSHGLKGVTQERIAITQNVAPIRNDDGKVIGVLIMEKDDTNNYNREFNMTVLAKTTEQLANELVNYDKNGGISTYINDAIIYFNENGISVYANSKARMLYENLGYRDVIIGMRFENLVLDKIKVEDIIANEYMEFNDLSIGNYVLKVQYSIMKENNKFMGIVMLITDVTEVRNKEKELILKSVAIKEIHHRVKNNLQTIASLLRLQSRRVEDLEVKKMFEESINRTLSIALTHEILANNGVDEVSIKKILEKLVKYTLQVATLSYSQIGITITGDDFNIESDTATSIALVVNELLQNCYQHAFRDSIAGNVEIKIEKGQLSSKITIEDDGIGVSKDQEKHNLGLKIVKSMIADKLGGNFDFKSSNNGTKVSFTFLTE